MKKWFNRFWTEHGDRIVFLGAATVMSISFLFIPELAEAGKAMLTVILGLLINKARSPKEEVKDSIKIE